MKTRTHLRRLVLVVASPLVLSCWPGVASAGVVAPPQPSVPGVVAGAGEVVDEAAPALPDVGETAQALPLPDVGDPVEEIQETVKQTAGDPAGAVEDKVSPPAAIPEEVAESARRTVEPAPVSQPGAAPPATTGPRSSKASVRTESQDRAQAVQRSRKAGAKKRGDKDDTRSIAAAGKRVHGTKVLNDSIFGIPRRDRGVRPSGSSGLPFTGAEVWPALFLGAALIAHGGALLAWGRRRRALSRGPLAYSTF